MDENSDTPNVEGQTTEPQKQNTNQPYAIFPDAASFMTRVTRETEKNQNKTARELGYDSFEAMKTAIQAQGQKKTDKKEDQPMQTNEVDRLRLALQVAGDLNLHPLLISRLQGSTIEELTADAQRLQTLFQTNQQSKVGIPNAPAGKSQPVTFTRDQLKDPAFVRANQQAILQASREGRIQ